MQALAEQSRIVRLPMNKSGAINQIRRAYAELEQKFEREPTEEELQILDHCIFQEILHGRGNQKMKTLLLNGVNYLAAQGCEAVVLACTELPLFISQADTEIPLFSSTEILAKVVVEECFR